MQSVTRDFVLSDDEYQELLRSLQKNTSIKRDYTRVTSLIMLHRGHLVKDISEAFDLNPNTIRSYVRPISLRYLTLTRLPSMIISLWHTLVIDIFLLQRSSGSS